jgi:ABC-type Fe3+-hydroxamate transport system substrate-binding protein
VRRLLFAVVLGCAACATQPQRSAPPAAHRRIVALIPSFVEDLVAIGAAPQIVGVSNATEDIPAVRGVPTVATFSSVDVERIVALRPDVVVAIPAQMRFLAPLQRLGIDVEQLPDDSYADIFTDLRDLGRISGRAAAARREIARLRAATSALRAQERNRKTPPAVFFVIGTQPIWTASAGSYIGTLIALAGGRDVVHLGLPYSEFSAEALLRLQPDAIVTDSTTHIGDVLGREPWRSLRAVQRRHVFIIADASLLERPGPRYVKGLAWLVAQINSLSP